MGADQVAVTAHAAADLEQIVRYIAQSDPIAAQRFGDRLLDRALTLGDPVISRHGAKLPKRPGVRRLIEGNYLILYRVLTDQNRIRVLRFWHGARDRAKLELGG
jgi:toxin ParE1/3/4